MKNLIFSEIAKFKTAIEVEDLKEARNNLWISTANSENMEKTDFQASPVGAPLGAPAVWCEIVD